MNWAVLWCNICNERWPISEEELESGNVEAHSCPRCGVVGQKWQSLRPSREPAAA